MTGREKRLIRPDNTELRQSNQWFTEPDKVELGAFIKTPNLTALRDFASQRSWRTNSTLKRVRLEVITHRLRELAQRERTRLELEAWIAEPIKPIAPERLARLLPAANPVGSP